MIHGLIDGFDPLNPKVFEDHLKYVKSQERDLWIDTFGNIGRYVHERENTQVRIIKQSERGVTFSLDTTLDKELFNVPLTVIIQTPENGEIMLNCLPDGKPLTIEW